LHMPISRYIFVVIEDVKFKGPQDTGTFTVVNDTFEDVINKRIQFPVTDRWKKTFPLIVVIVYSF
jgi:hypothetical protein